MIAFKSWLKFFKLARPERYPLVQSEAEYFIDGSYYVRDRLQYASYAVVTVKTTIEAQPLLQKTSSQKAELIGLNKALQLSARLQVISIH